MGEDSLLEIVRDAVRRQAALASDLRGLSEQYADMARQRKSQTEKKRKQIEGKLQKCREESFSLYERYKKEEISVSGTTGEEPKAAGSIPGPACTVRGGNG